MSDWDQATEDGQLLSWYEVLIPGHSNDDSICNLSNTYASLDEHVSVFVGSMSSFFSQEKPLPATPLNSTM